MTPEDRVKAIEHLVFNVYMQRHAVMLGHFLVDYSERVRQAITLGQALDMPIHLTPARLDLRAINRELVDSIIALDVLYNKTKDGQEVQKNR